MYVYLLILITILWGCGVICIKIILEEINVATFVLLRFGITSLCMIAALPFNKEINSVKDVIRGIKLGVFMTGCIFFHIMSINTISPSLASFLSGLPVFFMLFINFFILKKLPKATDLFITLICVLGLALITHGTGMVWNVGVSYGLASSFFSALHTFYVSRYSKMDNLFLLTLVQFIVPTLLAACVLLFSTEAILFPTKIITWSLLLFGVFFNTFIATALQIYCQRYVSPFKVSVIFLLEPVFATFFSFLYFHEHLDTYFYIGATLIFLSILSINSRLKHM